MKKPATKNGYPYYRLELHGAIVLFTLIHISRNTGL